MFILTVQVVSCVLAGKTPEEIRKTFNIKNDFTPEEEEQVWWVVMGGRGQARSCDLV